MISPLQTWQHQEHKGLWPAIGGLALLMHVGVIGMSVPYLLSWQASNEQSDSAAIPIDLVTVASEDQSNATQAEPAPLNNNAANSSASVSERSSERSELTAAPATATISPTATAPTAQQPSGNLAGAGDTSGQITTESNIENESSSSEPQSADDSSPEAPSSPENISDKPSDPVEPEAVPDTNEVDDFVEASESSDASTPQSPANPVDDISQEEAPPITPSEEESLPTVDGDALPAPAVGSEVGQSLQIRAVGVPKYDPVEDFEGVPPELIDIDYVGLLRPEAEGCGAVSALATQAPLIYRIAVSGDGSIYSASLQGGQAIAPDSADDKAVACLIKKTGITFSRVASDEGATPIDDSLLMTFELSEQ